MCPGHIVLPGASRKSRSQKSAVRSHHFEIQYSLFDNLRFAFVGLPGFKIQVTLKTLLYALPETQAYKGCPFN